MYQRTVWKDHVVQFPNRFTETPNGDGTTEHVASPGSTLQAGTNQDAAHFNNLEEALVYYTAAFEMNYAITQALLRKLAELATTSSEGLAPIATAPASGLRNIIGIDNGETSYANKALFDATAPVTQALGDAAAVGSAMAAARRDHKHAMPSLANVMTALQTVDGAASGLDADLLDGKHASVFEIADLEDVTAFSLYYAMSQATIRDLDSRLAIAEEELATIP